MSGNDTGGFNFDLCKRNHILEKKGLQTPGFTKTGTTIAGVIFKVIILDNIHTRFDTPPC